MGNPDNRGDKACSFQMHGEIWFGERMHRIRKYGAANNAR
jgi:hypothetical protein